MAYASPQGKYSLFFLPFPILLCPAPKQRFYLFGRVFLGSWGMMGCGIAERKN